MLQKCRIFFEITISKIILSILFIFIEIFKIKYNYFFILCCIGDILENMEYI